MIQKALDYLAPTVEAPVLTRVIPSMSPELIRVLLLEDNPGDARLVREALHDADRDTYVVVQAGRVAEALKMLQSQYFHILLLDLTLPGQLGPGPPST